MTYWELDEEARGRALMNYRRAYDIDVGSEMEYALTELWEYARYLGLSPIRVYRFRWDNNNSYLEWSGEFRKLQVQELPSPEWSHLLDKLPPVFVCRFDPGVIHALEEEPRIVMRAILDEFEGYACEYMRNTEEYAYSNERLVDQLANEDIFTKEGELIEEVGE